MGMSIWYDFFCLDSKNELIFDFLKPYISDFYGLLVHNCYVEDGQGEKQIIIDENGYVL